MFDIRNFKTIMWESIIHKKFIYQYLKENDLKEVAYTSKDTLNHLLPVLLKKVNLSCKNKNFANNLLRISKKQHLKMEYNMRLIDTISISYKIAKLEYISLFNYLFNLKILVFSSLRFESDFFNLIFNNLQTLKFLELKQIKINCNLSIGITTGDINLQIPLTLNKLVLKSNISEIVNDTGTSKASELVSNNTYAPLASISKLKFKNLQYLVLVNSNDSKNSNNSVINQYLNNNPGLIGLSVEYPELLNCSFNTLEKSEHLTFLNLLEFKFVDNFRCIEFKAINSLKSLSFDETIYTGNFQQIVKLVKYFPNVKNLKMIYTSHHILIEHLISKLPNLNSLVLLAKRPESIFNIIIRNTTLRKLNLINFILDDLKLNRLNNLQNLKILKLTNYSSNDILIDKDQLKIKLKKLGWDSVFIGKSINCSKN